MPESPEVRHQAKYLSARVQEGPLVEIEVLSGRYVKKPIDNLDELRSRLPLKAIGGGAHGKFMYVILEDGSSIHSTLGMTGGWSDAPTKHARIRMRFGSRELFFNDTRNFGTFKWCRDRKCLVDKLESLGPDIMQEIDDSVFITSLRRKNHWNICKALMDQSVVAGIGNYLKAEILYACEIDPRGAVADLDDAQLLAIRDQAHRISWLSYESGGATIQSYRNPDGSEGSFSRRFAVYGQETDPHGNRVEKIKVDDGRTTHWVPAVQSSEEMTDGFY